MPEKVAQFLAYLLTGLIQGLAEIFPISSSGHVILANALVKPFLNHSAQVSVNFLTFVHLAGIPIIGWVLRREINELLQGAWDSTNTLAEAVKSQNRQQFVVSLQYPVWKLLLSCAVTASVALIVSPLLPLLLNGAEVVAIILIGNGVLLFLIPGSRIGARTLANINWLDAVLLGIFQGIAVIPGISRLGLTLVMGLRRGMGWYDALKISLLLAIPTMVGAASWEFVRNPYHGDGLIGIPIPWIAGFLASGIGSYVAVTWLLAGDMYARRRLTFFASYCVMVGLFGATYLHFMP